MKGPCCMFLVYCLLGGCDVPGVTSYALVGVGSIRPVTIELYFESQCPDCQDFITREHGLNQTWHQLKNSGILDVHIFPYGNAQQAELPDGTWDFTCQHGPAECAGNIAEACILDEADYDPATYMNVIACMESSGDPYTSTQSCVETWSKLDFGQIQKCSEGPKGNKLHHEMGLRTDALEPSHNFVPWIVANGEHNNDIQNAAQDNLLKFVCDSYEGTKPAECDQAKLWGLFEKIQINIL